MSKRPHTRKELIFNNVKWIVYKFFWADRKSDEEQRNNMGEKDEDTFLARGEIEAAIDAGEITVDEIVEAFKAALLENLEEEV